MIKNAVENFRLRFFIYLFTIAECSLRGELGVAIYLYAPALAVG